MKKTTKKELSNNVVENTMKAVRDYRENISCPKGLKLNMQEKAELSALANSSFIIIFEVAERMVAFSKSIKTLNESIAPLEERIAKGEELNAEEVVRLQEDRKTIESLRVRYTVYKNIMDKKLAKNFAPLEGIYTGYKADVDACTYSFPKANKALKEFFAKHGIEYKGALKDFFSAILLNIQQTGAKDILKGKLFKASKESAFNVALLKGIIDIAICKHAITFNKVSVEAVDLFENYADVDEKITVVDEQPTTINEYKELFSKVGVDMTGMSEKADFEKAFAKYMNKMFIFNA